MQVGASRQNGAYQTRRLSEYLLHRMVANRYLGCLASLGSRNSSKSCPDSGGLDNRGDGSLAASLRGEALCEGNKRRMHRRRRASLEGYAAGRAHVRASWRASGGVVTGVCTRQEAACALCAEYGHGSWLSAGLELTLRAMLCQWRRVVRAVEIGCDARVHNRRAVRLRKR